jgi:hypothetical protein
MSTNDVPGYNSNNRDELTMGCWAEHEDGSLIFVESVENHRVIYSIFDMCKDPLVEYRDALSEDDFKKNFSWVDTTTAKKSSKSLNLKWTWHDKTRFPWERVIKSGAKDGLRYACASDMMTAAERVAESLKLRAQAVSDRTHMVETTRSPSKIGGFLRTLANALDELDRPRIR